MSTVPNFLSTKVRGFSSADADAQSIADYRSHLGSSSKNSSNMWGAAISAVGGIAQSLLGGNSAKKQFKYQQQLNAQQQSYAEQNAATAYERQRELTQDNPLLQKQGMRNAGMSTAFTDGSTVAGASSVDQASPAGGGSAPAVPTVADLFEQGAQAAASVADLTMKRADNRKTNAEAEGIEIENMYRERQQIADLKQKAASTHDTELAAAAKEMENAWQAKYGERLLAAQTGKAENDEAKSSDEAAITAIIRRYQDQKEVAELALKRQQLQNMIASEKLTKAETKKAYKEIEEINHKILFYDAQTANVKQDTRGKKIDNDIKQATKEDVIAITKSSRVKAWYDALPKDMQQVIMSSDVVRTAVGKLQNGLDLDAEDWASLGVALGYENAAKFVSMLSNLRKGSKAPKTSTKVSNPLKSNIQM